MTDLGHSLRESAYMLWDTLWALVLGFTLSGVVQAFVSRGQMQRRLGGHGPKEVVRATAYGVVSSSCSYAASAMARALVMRGADFVAAMVFMFASTNLVIELGVVLAVLIGWQFVAAEVVGGLVMIALLVAAGSALLRAGKGSGAPVEAEGDSQTTAARWSAAAGYTIGDLKMVRREIAIGFVVAGLLTTVVPTSAWHSLFLHGHGFWTSLENVVVGPLVAIASFVCSVGNVPLAAALWQGGISFGGVVSFVFADLITLPLLLIYRKQYGGRRAVRMLAVFWAVMSAAGLVTQYLFEAVGLVPTVRPARIAPDGIHWGYTGVLDLVSLVVLAGVWWLHRRARSGGSAGHATDPVCGMQVEIATAPAVSRSGDGATYFCSEHCQQRWQTKAGVL